MKSAKLIALLACLGSICTNAFADNTVQTLSINELPPQHRFKPKQCSLSEFPENGEFDQTGSTGRRIKAKVKNHCLDEEVFIYHPNGQLHSNTPLRDSLADGWSIGYTPNGIMQTKILYQQGKTVLMQRYDLHGKLVLEIK